MGKQIKNKKFTIISVILLLVLVIVCYFIISNFKISKVLSAKYDTIKCITSDCDGIIATRKNKDKEMVFLLNSKGKVISKYEKKSDKYEPYALSKNYFISSSQNDDKSKTTYVVYNKKGKQIYKTEEKLEKINDDYILISSDNEKFSIINKDGKVVYSDIKEVNLYDNNKFISAKIDKDYIIFDEKLEKVLTNYTVDKEVKDKNDEVLYLIVKDAKSEEYSYFDIKSSKIIGESFSSYKESDNEDEFLITKKVNNSKVTYILYKNGKQKKSDNSKSQIEIVNDIKSILNKDYYLYTSTVSSESNKYVLVDNLKENSIGTFNVKTKKYTEIYKYSKTENIYSTVNKIESKNKEYYQISCSLNICDTPVSVVYNLTDNKEILKNNDSDKIVKNYAQYENNYKVIKYAKTGENEDYKGKYVLYDNNNKEVSKLDNEIVVIDSKMIIGNDISDSKVALYNSKTKKMLTETKGEIINLNNENLYKYTNDNNEEFIVDNTGKEIANKSSNDVLVYSDDSILSGDKSIEVYNLNTNKKINYSLTKNEEITDVTSSVIKPYKGLIYVNNSKNKYFKIIKTNGKEKKIKKLTIDRIMQNKDKDVIIITKNSSNKYGLYIIK